MVKHAPYRPATTRLPLPRSFKDLTPAKHFNPRTFFREMVWKALLTRRTGKAQRPAFPKLKYGQVAITWIGHASFLLQFTDLNVLIDPNFANWLFLLKRIKRSGLKIKHLPPIDVVLLTHAHFDHFHKPTLRRLPHPKIGIMPWGVGDLARNLGFGRDRRAGMVGELLTAGLEGDVDALQALGCAHTARPSSRVWRVRAGTPGPAYLSRGRQRLL